VIEPALSDEAFLADVESVAGDPRLHLWWLGQSGFLVKWRAWLVLLDPYLSDSLTRKYAGTGKPHVRMTRRVVDPNLLPEVMFVTATHGHTDHLDAETLRSLHHADSPTTLIAPAAIGGLAAERWGGTDNLILMDSGQCQGFVDVGFIAVPAAHDAIEVDERARHKYLGYVVRLGPWTVYHSGDTVVYDGMVERLRPFDVDLAILPINGKLGNMSGRDAARLAHDIGAKLVVPCHYDMFEFNTANPRDEFVPECERLGQPYKVLRAGERLTLG
jgi:L-ascorbate metabolism protein UlaG (beta-lactamase superfamily)